LDQPRVERLPDHELDLIRPLLVDLHLAEQPHYADHPQLTRQEVEGFLPRVRPAFDGENVVLAVKDGGRVVAFCWCVLFDPGTGLEGEVAEVYVAEDHRNQRLGDALLREAIKLFEQRGVTLGYVWTRAENQAAVRLYQAAGFQPTSQLILTWYPRET
jgi:ribosomal protein S18 acetylase RimI-like enzyme